MSAIGELFGIGAGEVRPHHAARTVAFVGAGGKTTGVYLLSHLASLAGTARVIVTTTTMMFDPLDRFSGRVIVDPRLSLWASATAAERADILSGIAAALEAAAGKPVLIASAVIHEAGKLKGIPAAAACALAAAADGALCDLLLVEADGARMLPIKAPGPNEPVVPEVADIVVGVVGLDALGAPLDAAHAHRPEILSAVSGCAIGDRMTQAHVAALAVSPEGFFKNAPLAARKILALNKADLLGDSRQEAGSAARRLADEMAPLLPAGIELAVCSFARDILYAHSAGQI